MPPIPSAMREEQARLKETNTKLQSIRLAINNWVDATRNFQAMDVKVKHETWLALNHQLTPWCGRIIELRNNFSTHISVLCSRYGPTETPDVEDIVVKLIKCIQQLTSLLGTWWRSLSAGTKDVLDNEETIVREEAQRTLLHTRAMAMMPSKAVNVNKALSTLLQQWLHAAGFEQRLQVLMQIHSQRDSWLADLIVAESELKALHGKVSDEYLPLIIESSRKSVRDVEERADTIRAWTLTWYKSLSDQQTAEAHERYAQEHRADDSGRTFDD